jgi:photosystem II stability/assembly factor-like uncharacterized protein
MLVVFGVSLLIRPAPTTADDNADFHRFWPDNLFAVDFISDRVGFIAGYSGTLLRTIDGGNNWEAIYVGVTELIRRISFVDESTGWAIGHRGSILHTVDGGQSWEIQKQLAGVYLRDIDFIDKYNGWVVGHDANIWNTKDGGRTWHQQRLLGFSGRDVPRLHGIYAKSADNALLVGEFGVVAHTENGGDVWLVTPVESDITWLAIDGGKDKDNNEKAYVVGLDGQILSLTLATDSQREAIIAREAEKQAKAETRARKKAKRLGREFSAKKAEQLPVSDIEYAAEFIDSKTNEHLFDIAITAAGEAVVVGRSVMLKIVDATSIHLQADVGFPLSNIWLGGIDVLPDASIWAAGIRGLVVSGNLEEMRFGQAFNMAASENVKLVSSRWRSQ